MSDLEPIPETTAAVEDFGPFADGEGDLVDELKASAARVRELVPQCVGLSVGLQEHGVTFTLVSSDQLTAALDAVQYVAGGPCVAGVEAERVLQYTSEELFAEAEWQLFAQATAASSIASTLTLPILIEERVVGTVNLYASTRDAFTGHHQAIASIFGAWAPGAVANADLGFSTRRLAENAPRVLRDEVIVNAAIAALVGFQGIDPEAAQAQLEEVARRAGTTVEAVAHRLVAQASDGPIDEDE